MSELKDAALSDRDGRLPTQPGPGWIDGVALGAVDGAVDGVDPAALRREIDNLKAALQSRTTISTGVGVLVAHYRISPDRAFELLVRWSQHRNIKLRLIAETLIAVSVHGSEAPGTDRALALWLSEQLTGTPLTARADLLRGRTSQDGNGAGPPRL